MFIRTEKPHPHHVKYDVHTAQTEDVSKSSEVFLLTLFLQSGYGSSVCRVSVVKLESDGHLEPALHFPWPGQCAV